MLDLKDRKVAIAIVTAPSLKSARKLARLALEKRVVACANLLPGIESHYWWRGKLAKGKEVLIVFKTLASLLGRLEELVVEHHPYDTPEFIALPISGGNRRYLRWCEASIQ
jgi:periplasmic divalent cation tolerance protein